MIIDGIFCIFPYKNVYINNAFVEYISLLLGTGGGGDGGLSDAAVIAIAAALILLVLALSIGSVYCFIKRKRRPQTDAFTLLDNDQSDFVNSNTVTLGDSY